MSTRADSRPIILASSSPRRRQLLALTGLDFQVRPAAADETVHSGETPEAYAQRMSRTKARSVAANAQPAADSKTAGAEPGPLVIGADTIVVLDDDPLDGAVRGDGEPGRSSILGKPRDAAEAVEMLRRLRGRAHRVLTAISVVEAPAPAARDDLVTARVPMRAYGDDEVRAYVATGNPLDKAGAYAIQFAGFQPVDREHFADCFATVMGLPVCSLLGLLAPAGVAARLARPPADCHHFQPAACPIYPFINPGG